MKLWNILFGFLFLCSSFLFSQETTVQIQQDTITRTAPIFYDANGYRINYGATMPQLNQIAGAPKAFYSYYWEMGDGDFSFDEKPSHAYKKKGPTKYAYGVPIIMTTANRLKVDKKRLL